MGARWAAGHIGKDDFPRAREMAATAEQMEELMRLFSIQQQAVTNEIASFKQEMASRDQAIRFELDRISQEAVVH